MTYSDAVLAARVLLLSDGNEQCGNVRVVDADEASLDLLLPRSFPGAGETDTCLVDVGGDLGLARISLDWGEAQAVDLGEASTLAVPEKDHLATRQKRQRLAKGQTLRMRLRACECAYFCP